VDCFESCDRNPGWTFKSEKKLTRDEKIRIAIWKCINKELEFWEETYSTVSNFDNWKYWYKFEKTTKKFLGIKFSRTKKVLIPWNQYFYFDSKESFMNWKEFCIKTLKEDLKMSHKAAEVEFNNIDLLYGLKKTY